MVTRVSKITTSIPPGKKFPPIHAQPSNTYISIKFTNLPLKTLILILGKLMKFIGILFLHISNGASGLFSETESSCFLLF